MLVRQGKLIVTALAAACAVALVAGTSVAASPTAGATRVGAASASHPLTVLLGLRRDDAGLERFAAAVSDPGSPRYGHYLDVPQIARRFGASAATRRAVLRALRRRGLRARIGSTGGWAEVDTTVAGARRLLSTGFAGFRSARGARFVAPTGRPALPADLRGAVTELVGLDDERTVQSARPPRGPFPDPTQEELDRRARQLGSSIRANTGTPAGCAAGRAAGIHVGRIPVPGYTPNEYLDAYGYDTLHARGFQGQGQRIAVMETDGFRRSDIETFGRCFGRRVPPTPITRVGIKKNLTPGDETELDLQVITAAAPGVTEIQVYETAGTNATLIQGYERALAVPKRRRVSVISASLGQCEPDFYATQRDAPRLFEQAFTAAAAAGVSNVASAGDTGSSGCSLDDNSSALALLSVNHPAVSPHVTGVGGTNLVLNSGNEITDEIVWHDPPLVFGGGSGGFSLLFRRPSWQRGLHVGGTQREVPDIAMLADIVPGYNIYCTSVPCRGEGWLSVGGTSAAAPLFASGVAIVNQQARRAGQRPLGFLNPLIYKLASRASTRTKVFRDITQVSNDFGEMLPKDAGGGQKLGCCKADRHYDAASGWGSINLPAFSTEARRLTAPRVR